jgi:hypothetical protein
LAEHRERSDAPIPVAIETAKGLLPAALRVEVAAAPAPV